MKVNQESNLNDTYIVVEVWGYLFSISAWDRDEWLTHPSHRFTPRKDSPCSCFGGEARENYVATSHEGSISSTCVYMCVFFIYIYIYIHATYLVAGFLSFWTLFVRPNILITFVMWKTLLDTVHCTRFHNIFQSWFYDQRRLQIVRYRT